MAKKAFGVDGMTCMGCVGSLQGRLMSEPGIKRANISLADNSAEVEFDDAAVDEARILAIVREVGFEPRDA